MTTKIWTKSADPVGMTVQINTLEQDLIDGKFNKHAAENGAFMEWLET